MTKLKTTTAFLDYKEWAVVTLLGEWNFLDWNTRGLKVKFVYINETILEMSYWSVAIVKGIKIVYQL